jgi:hypothetical protein
MSISLRARTSGSRSIWAASTCCEGNGSFDFRESPQPRQNDADANATSDKHNELRMKDSRRRSDV